MSAISSRVLAAAFAGALPLLAGTAMAGECPAGKVVDQTNRPIMTEPKDVTDVVLASIDLSSLNPALAGSQLRLRRLVVEPGGVVPNHAHDERPANILMLEGSITEYRSTCEAPIEHKAGEAVTEFGHLTHWWRNNGDKPAVLISADLLGAEATDDKTM